MQPDEAGSLLRDAQRKYQEGRHQDALNLSRAVERLPGLAAEHLDQLGTLLTHLGEPKRALDLFERAVALAPDTVDYRYNLAMTERMCGEFERAEANLNRVLLARPMDGEAYHALSGLRTQSADRNHVPQLQAALRLLAGKRAALPVAFALAKELEDLGQHARSFAALRAACRAYRGSLRYDVGDDVAVLENLSKAHAAEVLRGLTSSSEDPHAIFVIGLPRSGTTLVERILSGHSQVFAGGETDAFQRVLIRTVAERFGRRVSKLEFVDRMLEVDLAKVGSAYLAEVGARACDAARFVDKSPINYLYAGAIHAALPHARFVALRRNPMDACYAMYKTLFAMAYPFTYDLSDLGRYYVAWERLMRHWETLIGPAWLTVNYEELVVEPERVSRDIMAHSGLSWEEGCVQIYRSTQAVTTASAVQVRQPIHSRSVGTWRHYAAELAPLIRHFQTHGVDPEA